MPARKQLRLWYVFFTEPLPGILISPAQGVPGGKGIFAAIAVLVKVRRDTASFTCLTRIEFASLDCRPRQYIL